MPSSPPASPCRSTSRAGRRRRRRGVRGVAAAHGATRLMGQRCIVVGDVMMDVTALIESEIVYASDTPARVSLQPGGSAANTAAWMGAMGQPGHLRRLRRQRRLRRGHPGRARGAAASSSASTSPTACRPARASSSSTTGASARCSRTSGANSALPAGGVRRRPHRRRLARPPDRLHAPEPAPAGRRAWPPSAGPGPSARPAASTRRPPGRCRTSSTLFREPAPPPRRDPRQRGGGDGAHGCPGRGGRPRAAGRPAFRSSWSSGAARACSPRARRERIDAPAPRPRMSSTPPAPVMRSRPGSCPPGWPGPDSPRRWPPARQVAALAVSRVGASPMVR